MIHVDNPYASALDGLVINDPVMAFFNFCKERENIRLKREMGIPFPWTQDPIFQKGRFLNVFREDDRGSKAIMQFAKNLEKDLPTLIHALFFSRWCNRQETLDQLTSSILSQPTKLSDNLKSLDQWCNLTAYPVEPVQWNNQEYNRLDSATKLFGKIKNELTNIVIEANRDVVKATNLVNKHFQMKNDFPIFMAIIDIAWFRPDIIDPASPVPTGIGAVAYLDRLQKHFELDNHEQTCNRMIKLQDKYWPEAKRTFQSIDIEYLSCECRKYYSYINETKLFEGKNVFHLKQ
tara:strand:+ start:210 stop:1082 length:873 start_codon:yes stop_codon:yes gene_type:complete